MNPTIVWFRQDLRVEDQPALFAAISKGGPVIPLFVWCPQEEKEGSLGAASRWWLHHSLKSLQNELKTLNLHLIIRQQPALQALLAIAAQTGADTVLWNRRYEPSIMQQDGFIKAALHRQGIQTHSFNATLLFEPWDVANKKGKPFQVFTPFWKRCCQLGVTEPPLSKPPPAVKYAGEVDSEQVENLRLLPTVKWDQGFKESWQPGVSGAHLQLKEALPLIENYGGTRDFPAIQGTSQLSPYLHFGEISVRMVWFAVKRALGESKGVNAYLRQLGWREFAYHLLYHFPHTVHEPLRTNFTSFAWQKDEQALKAWQRGQTGYPLVDAGMRQLWQTGWMHNRGIFPRQRFTDDVARRSEVVLGDASRCRFG
jgi:deoxyribodipyrimidine photo-lyase